jgi:hypothetical protein
VGEAPLLVPQLQTCALHFDRGRPRSFPNRRIVCVSQRYRIARLHAGRLTLMHELPISYWAQRLVRQPVYQSDGTGEERSRPLDMLLVCICRRAQVRSIRGRRCT